MTDALAPPAPIEERHQVDTEEFAEIVAGYHPIVLRSLVHDWPATVAGRQGNTAIGRYIAGFDSGRPADVMVGPPEIAGRFFYRDDIQGFNFRREKVPISAVVSELLRLVETLDPPAVYAGAAAAAAHLPGWIDANSLPIKIPPADARIWIGNATHISTHFDVSHNVACVVAGTRRFLLFPPEQVANLYVGPLEVTMAGQPVSMVNPNAPDLVRYPRFAKAMEHALTAELEPGDAIFIPSMWWHNVQAAASFNVLVNYWWTETQNGSAMAALAQGLLAIRDLPSGERAAWRSWFDHYVFADDAAEAANHLPEHSRGALGQASSARSDQIRRFLQNAAKLR